MRNAHRRLTMIFFIALVAIAAMANTAQASKSQFTALQDDGMLLSTDTVNRDATLDELQALGVETVKIALIWRNVAPASDSSSKPSGFDGSDPSGYGGGFAAYRSLVDAVKARGMNSWLILITPAPKWAAPKNSKRQPGVYEPNADEFGDFAQAAGSVFPDVNIWSILNEPNHQAFLEPQVKYSGYVHSAVLYRELVYEATDGLVRSGHYGDNILFGGMAPRAGKPVKGAKSVWPLAFLRQFFCLNSELRPVTGQAAKRLRCTGRFKRVNASGFAYHPYTGIRSPLSAAPTPDDALIGQLPRLYKILDRAHSLRRLKPKRVKLWNAEFGFQTLPPDPFGAKIARVPAYLNLSEYISWKDSRVVNFQQYQLVDSPPDLSQPPGSLTRYQGFQSGLRFSDGSKKPGIYDSFELPIVVEKTGSSKKVSVWGGIRAFTGTPQTVEIQVKNGSGFETVASVMVTNSQGYFQTKVPLDGASSKTWRIIWNGKNSRSTKAVAKVKPKR